MRCEKYRFYTRRGFLASFSFAPILTLTLSLRVHNIEFLEVLHKQMFEIFRNFFS